MTPTPHSATGVLVYAVVHCGKCAEVWEQPGIDFKQPGWVVCPHCNEAAPLADRRDRRSGAA